LILVVLITVKAGMLSSALDNLVH